MLEIFLTIIHILVCFFLIIVVLLQSGKAADLAGAFGGMGSQTAFGPRGAATLLSKATTIAAVLFMLTSIWLGIEAGSSSFGGAGESVIERTGTGAVAPEAAQPGQAPAGAGQPGQPAQPFESMQIEPIEEGAPEAQAPATAAPETESGTPAPQKE
ncbi:MAG TPA: preprotein translocase subunit SecG [Bryobacterales bacterium]|nr:preprotein translocase subunit SecG [Bryobacterales bacterium]